MWDSFFSQYEDIQHVLQSIQTYSNLNYKTMQELQHVVRDMCGSVLILEPRQLSTKIISVCSFCQALIQKGERVVRHPLWPEDKSCESCQLLPRCIVCERRAGIGQFYLHHEKKIGLFSRVQTGALPGRNPLFVCGECNAAGIVEPAIHTQRLLTMVLYFLKTDNRLLMNFDQVCPNITFHIPTDKDENKLSPLRTLQTAVQLVDIHYLSHPHSTTNVNNLFGTNASSNNIKLTNQTSSEWREDLVFGRCECLEHQAMSHADKKQGKYVSSINSSKLLDTMEHQQQLSLLKNESNTNNNSRAFSKQFISSHYLKNSLLYKQNNDTLDDKTRQNKDSRNSLIDNKFKTKNIYIPKEHYKNKYHLTQLVYPPPQSIYSLSSSKIVSSMNKPLAKTRIFHQYLASPLHSGIIDFEIPTQSAAQHESTHRPVHPINTLPFTRSPLLTSLFQHQPVPFETPESMRGLKRIFIANGLPEDTFASTLAHELLHAYIFYKGYQFPLICEEGLCNAVCMYYVYCRAIDYKKKILRLNKRIELLNSKSKAKIFSPDYIITHSFLQKLFFELFPAEYHQYQSCMRHEHCSKQLSLSNVCSHSVLSHDSVHISSLDCSNVKKRYAAETLHFNPCKQSVSTILSLMKERLILRHRLCVYRFKRMMFGDTKEYLSAIILFPALYRYGLENVLETVSAHFMQ